MLVSQDFIIETIRSPEQLEFKEDNKRIAQKKLNESLVIRVVYHEFNAFILVITFYPGRRTRSEKNELQ